MAEYAANNFRGDQTQRGSHGPGENRGAHGRMLVAVVMVAMTMAVIVIVIGGRTLVLPAAVSVFVPVRMHRGNLHSTRSRRLARSLWPA